MLAYLNDGRVFEDVAGVEFLSGEWNDVCVEFEDGSVDYYETAFVETEEVGTWCRSTPPLRVINTLH